MTSLRWRDFMAAVALGAAAALCFVNVFVDGPEPAVREPTPAEIEAHLLVNAALIEMNGYGPDGTVGKFLYDCEHAEDPAPGEPTLICTQREEQP